MYEDFEKEYKKQLIKFLKKHFIGKNIHFALGEVLEKAVINLTQSYAKFLIIRDCLDTILKNDNSLEMKDKEPLEEVLCSLNSLCSDLEKILEPIGEGLCSE